MAVLDTAIFASPKKMPASSAGTMRKRRHYVHFVIPAKAGIWQN